MREPIASIGRTSGRWRQWSSSTSMSFVLISVSSSSSMCSFRICSSTTTGITVRAISAEDLPALGSLYFDAYEHGVASTTLEDAIADIGASFDGAYGHLLLDASRGPVASGAVVAVAMTVQQAPWGDVPAGPFSIQLFTARLGRRLGPRRPSPR